jgi:hypothetical protein
MPREATRGVLARRTHQHHTQLVARNKAGGATIGLMKERD